MAGKAEKSAKAKAPKKRPVRTALAKGLLKIPGANTLYLKGTLRYIENTPAAKLPPELRDAKVALEKLPKNKRLQALKELANSDIKSPEDLPSRQLRRMAEKQQRQQQRRR